MSYLGGKGNCYSRVLGAMPTHRVYIETHLGGGAVMRAKRPVERQIGVDADERVIDTWRRRGAPCELVHGDATCFLSRFPFAGEELVYSDPPYPLESRGGRNRYRYDYSEYDHAALLEVLVGLNCYILVSGQPTSLYRERLAGWRRIDFRSGARRGGRIETLWANFPEPDFFHEPAKTGTTFRDRERVKRRLTTIQRKVERMDHVERSRFVEWVVSTYPEQVGRAGKEVVWHEP
jgi:DNA adenine methylase